MAPLAGTLSLDGDHRLLLAPGALEGALLAPAAGGLQANEVRGTAAMLALDRRRERV